MPSTLTYPGVYIEEIPSGVRTITGVSTSVTAFIGRALRGPVDTPITINNFGDFERVFGGLAATDPMGYAVRDFFMNGGAQAIIVRLYREDTSSALPKHAIIELPSGMKFIAADPGAWGNSLRIRIDHDVLDPTVTDPSKSTLFNITIRDGITGQIETIRNVSTAEAHSRRIDKVLERESRFLRAFGALPSLRPTPHAAVSPGESPFLDATSTGVDDADKASDGKSLQTDDYTGSLLNKTGLYALEKADLFNMLCIPPYFFGEDGDVVQSLWSEAAAYCERRRAMLIVDAPDSWKAKEDAKDGIGLTSKNAALYFPRLIQPNPRRDNQLESFAPCGAVAGAIARTDAQRGVWKAPAGLDTILNGVPGLTVDLTDAENGELNPLGINCLRVKPAAGRVVWGARTLQGDDRLASEWKYLPVRRTALFIEESLYRGTQWVVFEPNDEPLWSQIRLNVGAFMHNLFRQGAFQGKTPKEAYLVKCDSETTTQNDINLGIVNIVVGFAPLKPAEFVVIKIQQLAGQIEA